MKSRQKYKKLLITVGMASSAIAFATASLAQSPFFFPSASFFSPAAAVFQSEDEPSVEEVLEELPKHESFYTQLQDAELLENMPTDSVTIFAPTDEALAALPIAVKEKLSKPENLTKLLQYHMVVGIIGEQDIQRQAVATLLDKSYVQITGIPLAEKKVIVLKM